MPPPQHLLASRIRGFVCRSCLIKLQSPRQQRISLVPRNLSTAVVIPKRDRKDVDGSQTQVDPTVDVQYWDQAPDGTRAAVRPGEDAEEKELRESVEREVREMEEQSGKSIEELVGVMTGDQKDVEEAMQRNMTRILKDGLGDMDFGPTDEQMATLEAQGEEMNAQRQLIESYGGIEKMRHLSDEERLKVREVLLAPMRKAMAKARYVPKLSSLSSSDFPAEISVVESSDAKPTSAVLVRDNLLIPLEAYPEHARNRISQLNEALFLTTSSTHRSVGRRKRVQTKAPRPKDIIQEIWRAYILCRKTLVKHAEYVPQRTWLALWNKLAEEGPHNMDRMGHIKYLGDDMRSSGIPLAPHQRLLYIEALYIDDDRNLAIKAWEDLKHDSEYHLETPHHRTDKRFFQVSYWELGIRMFSLNNQPNQAFEAAEALFAITQDSAAYRALLPIIQAYLAADGPTSNQRAWALYVQMRLKLGSQMTMADYDNIISAFLSSNQPYLALGVFKDMMLTGNKSLANRDSVAPYKQGSDPTAGFTTQISVTELDWKDEKLLGSLPAQFNNKFFFGSWIKKLIGDGELDLAKKVFDLMEDRGIVASPIHLNGLIGAWYRDGSERYRAMAEDTAWKMITARVNFVRKRDTGKHSWDRLDGHLRVIESDDIRGFRALSPTPHATIETFAILIQQYRRRQRNDLTPALFDALQKAKVVANTCFLNELLLSDTRTHNVAWAWTTYHSLTSAKKVRPDIETFVILWNLMKKVLDPIVRHKDQSPDRPRGRLPTAQQLFANMMEHLSSKALRLKVPKELYDSIILAFSLSEDQVGTAVALRALRRKFNAMPTPDTVRMIVYQLSRFGMEQGNRNKPAQRMNLDSETTQQRIATVAKILDKFKTERAEALKQRGVIFAHLNDVAKLEETELLLSDLLRYVAQARHGKDQNSAEACRIVADRMGVPDCVPWEALA